MSAFAMRLIRWQRKHGRNALPWQGADAYHVWLSEIMLQQTQVATVIPYYQRFAARFPDVALLAQASEDEVLAHWSGLGYYSRARNLHRAAQDVMRLHDGKFPCNFDDIMALPGVGRSTAAAICALACHRRYAILDGNVKRVLARYFAIEGYTGEKKIEAQLWQQAEALLPQKNIADYTQGLMDLGALVCTRSKPQCAVCPVRVNCMACKQERVAQLPTPRPRKALPQRHSTFLLLLNGNDILLEKRPASGIWGGLWCPPQFVDAQQAWAWCAQKNLPLEGRNELSPFTHTFTHFKLNITPLLLALARKPGQVEQPGSFWLDIEDALQAAIPAPVRKLMLGLCESRLNRAAIHEA